MSAVLAVLAVLAFCGQVEAQGRAIPIQAESETIAAFRSLNDQIEYDVTNYLVDLSGRYANCANRYYSDFMEVDHVTQEGESIQAIVDSMDGTEHYTSALVRYIDVMVDKWVQNPDYIQQIKGATRFGCSVRPGCQGRVSFACLFSPGTGGGFPPPNIIVTPPPRESEAPVVIRGVAFTPQQYAIAEAIFGQIWDRSYLLENLSGQDINCNMMHSVTWAWSKMRALAEERGLHLSGVFGSHANTRGTQHALVRILEEMKEFQSKHVGCSLITDCQGGYGDITEDVIVVACIYSAE